MKLVMIDWVDASSCRSGGAWVDVETAKSETEAAALRIKSVGWLLVDGKDSKVIVAHQSFGGPGYALNQVSGDMTIPTSAIRKMKVLSK